MKLRRVNRDEAIKTQTLSNNQWIDLERPEGATGVQCLGDASKPITNMFKVLELGIHSRAVLQSELNQLDPTNYETEPTTLSFAPASVMLRPLIG